MPFQVTTVQIRSVKATGEALVRFSEEAAKELKRSAVGRYVNIGRDIFNSNLDVGNHVKRRVVGTRDDSSIVVNLNDVPIRRITGDIAGTNAEGQIVSRRKGTVPRSFFLTFAYGRPVVPAVPVQRKTTGWSPFRQRDGQIGRRRPLTSGGRDLTVPIPGRTALPQKIVARLLADPVTFRSVGRTVDKAFKA